MRTTNAKHTPGPWSILERSMPPEYVDVYGNGRLVATVWNKPGTSGSVALANAALIAQAPTMAARIAELERTLAVVTAQRDRLAAEVHKVGINADALAESTPGYSPHLDRIICACVRARAALRACDEKRSEASIAAEGGAK